MKSFLQSSEWASFQKSLGRKVFCVENKLIIKYPLPAGLSFLYAPRVGFSSEKTFKLFLHETKKIAKLENAIFARIEPDLIENFNIENSLKIKNLKLKITPNVQPQDTLVLDLKKPEKEILDEMHSKTRYNIHLAEKHKVKIVKTIDPKDIDIFYNLALGTSRRDGFSYHEREYYKKMLETLGPSGTVKIYLAYYEKTPLAANLVLFYQDTAIYLHGASDHNQRKFMAPYLLQWQAICDAKKSGYHYYDFWGIAPRDSENHPWAGITRFKKGFTLTGEIIHYPPCLELTFQPFWYKLYKLTRKHK